MFYHMSSILDTFLSFQVNFFFCFSDMSRETGVVRVKVLQTSSRCGGILIVFPCSISHTTHMVPMSVIFLFRNFVCMFLSLTTKKGGNLLSEESGLSKTFHCLF